jgi:hypothetical protein
MLAQLLGPKPVINEVDHDCGGRRWFNCRWVLVSQSMPVMMLRRSSAAVVFCMLLAGCGRSSNAPIAARPDVIITFNGARHACVVALYNEPQGSTISCSDLVPFLRDELRLSSGSIYDVHTVSNADEAEMTRVAASLKAAGYRFIGGPHATAAFGTH